MGGQDKTVCGLTGQDDANDLWVFGYGSLMWRPDFDYVERAEAVLQGMHRRFCVYSFHHRGTPTRPGLVLGLDRGGVCHGAAFRVAADLAPGVIAYLRAREQVTGIYVEVQRLITLKDGSGRRVKALSYGVERAHPQYTGVLPLSVQARIIQGASGRAGVNLDYLLNTFAHLQSLGIVERELERLKGLVGPHLSPRGRGNNGLMAQRTRAMTANFQRSTHPQKPLSRVSVARFLHRRNFSASRC